MYKQLLTVTVLSFATSVGFAASFSELDENSDDKVTRDEYYGTISDWGTYSDWDTNDDGLIDVSEFDAGPFEGEYVYWDYNDDGYLDSYEIYNGVYATYDSNDDGYWANGEWHDFDQAGLYD